MKVLFIGPYRQSDGWGEAAKDYIHALNLTKYDVAIRPVFMSKNTGDIDDPVLLELEQRHFEGQPDIVIQNVLPQVMTYIGGSINIGLSYFETDNLDYTGWTRHMNLMDRLWVASNRESQIVKSPYCHTPADIVHMPIDTDKLDKDVPEFALPAGKYYFYFIGELIDRKNLDALLVAFHREFNPSEQVGLVIKTSKPRLSPAETTMYLREKLGTLRKNMRLYNDLNAYHSEIIITNRLSDEQLIGLHKACDCFVMPSCGESLCRPLMDATYLGNATIYTNETGMCDVGMGMSVKCHNEPVFITDTPPLPNLYTSRETWKKIDIVSLQSALRAAFNHRGPDSDFVIKYTREEQQKSMKKRFSYQAIANRMEELIDGYSN